MKKLFLILLMPVIVFSCKEQMKENKTVTGQTSNESLADNKPTIAYTSFIANSKKEISRLRQEKDADSIRKLVYNNIALGMPLYWNGTKWDFNGATRIPGEGTIACGYFITTILDDIGLKLNRVRLAQEPSSVLIKSTCNKIKMYAGFEELKDYLRSSEDKSIFITGLDFHTGFIIKDGDKYYFFHSNYINRMGVIKELIDESKALKSSKSFMIGSLTGNKDYLLK